MQSVCMIRYLRTWRDTTASQSVRDTNFLQVVSCSQIWCVSTTLLSKIPPRFRYYISTCIHDCMSHPRDISFTIVHRRRYGLSSARTCASQLPASIRKISFHHNSFVHAHRYTNAESKLELFHGFSPGDGLLRAERHCKLSPDPPHSHSLALSAARSYAPLHLTLFPRFISTTFASLHPSSFTGHRPVSV